MSGGIATLSSVKRPNLAVALVVGFLVLLWTLPTVGLLITSFRTPDQIDRTGWWQALFPTDTPFTYRTPTLTVNQADADSGLFVAVGNVFDDSAALGQVQAWGVSSREPTAAQAGESLVLRGGERVTVQADGAYTIESDAPIDWRRGQRLQVTAIVPPQFTFANYQRALFEPERVDGMMRGLIGTASVAIPSTIIPIMIAAFAAYALAWMQLAGREVILGLIIALLVVPLQLAFIPLLQLFNSVGLGKSYFTLLMAHTGFGLPLAIFLLYNYIRTLPAELIQSARVEGANDFQIFTQLVVPLSIPALASFSIFQFLWTWNDLLVARVFFITPGSNNTVMTSELVELLGSRGGDWEILATSAFISMVIPLMVFFALQRYLVRGLLAGSVK